MQPKEWSINALSVELRRDRRTLNQIISDAGVMPVKELSNGRKYYRMVDVVNAMLVSDELDLQHEKALLTVEQRRKLERENTLAEGLVAPVENITTIMSKAVAQITGILDALPLNLKKTCPALSARDIVFIRKEIAKCRNNATKTVMDECDNYL